MAVLKWGEVELVHDLFSCHICSGPFDFCVRAELFNQMKNNKTEVMEGATGFIQQLLSLKTHLNEPTEPVWELSRHRRSCYMPLLTNI